MSKAKEFIKSKIRIGSNISSNGWRRKGVFIPLYSLPWLTPDQERKAVEIAREEAIEKAVLFLDKHLVGWNTNFIRNFKEAMRKEE